MTLKENPVKKLAIIAISTMISLTTFAQQPPTELPLSLSGTMKSMSSTLKKIAAQVSDSTKNSDSEKLSDELVALTKAAKDFVPKKASDTDKQQQYLKMIDDTVVLSQELAAAFHNNDNAKAVDILNKLSAAKKEGHTAFK